MVCVAVKEGGQSSALADEIAHEHLLPDTVGGPISVIHNDGMSPSGGGKSSGNESFPAVARRDISPADDVMSPESGKSNNLPIYAHHPEKNHPLTNKIYELKDEFADALQLTTESFENKPDLLPKIIEYLKRRVHALLGPLKSDSATEQAVKEEFSDIKTMIDLFSTLQDKYVSWFNYELIVRLVRVFLSDNRSLKRTWSAYEEKLKDYFINSGGLLKDVDAVQFGIKDVPPGTRVMIAKVDSDDYTPADLFFYRRAIPKGCDIPHFNLYFLRVCPGSVILECLIPEYLYSLLFPLTTKLQQQLASIGITELTCGEDKYDLKKFLTEKVKHSFTDIDTCDPLWYENTSTPLHEAAWRGLKDEVQWLLNEFGYSTYHRGLHGWTPLHSASYGGHIKILQLLINQYGIDPNEGDDNSVSSIHMASYKGHLSIVQYLVDTCHVPPDQPDNSNNTALLYSAIGGHSDLVEYFIKKKCNPSQINCHAGTLSLLACKSGQLTLICKLEALDLFIPNSYDFCGFGILHYSSMSNSVELFKYLLNRYQLSIDIKDQYGRTPLHIASWYASSSVVEYIVSIQGNEAIFGKHLLRFDSIREYIRPFYEAIHAPYKMNKWYWFGIHQTYVLIVYIVEAIGGGHSLFLIFFLILIQVFQLITTFQAFSIPFKSKLLNIMNLSLLLLINIVYLNSWYISIYMPPKYLTLFIAGSIYPVIVLFCCIIVYHILLTTAQLGRVTHNIGIGLDRAKMCFDFKKKKKVRCGRCPYDEGSFFDDQYCNTREPLLEHTQ